MENRALAKTKDEETIVGHTEKLLDNYNTLKNVIQILKT
ncbi:hypothetical protein B0H42_003899 [Clostridium saccharobutylicum]|nr:hypothetical protein [Clostridium saccharobutylicum]